MILLAVLTLFAAGVTVSLADEPGTTTGPNPPQSSSYRTSAFVLMDSQTVMSGVPAYNWTNGCTPTAIGMIIGYWDSQGFDNLVPGSAATQTSAVSAMISSTGNYNDYCLPIDSGSTILPDKSEPPVGDEHANDCVADFAYTSQSHYSNAYGWTKFSCIPLGFNNYVKLREPTSIPSATNYMWGYFTWAQFCAEINANRPVALLVDSNADNVSDHSVTAIGYGVTGGKNMYACYTTWDADVHWYEFAGTAVGRPFGIVGATFCRIQQGTSGSRPVARFTATPSSGAAPLSVAFNGSTSTDTDGSIVSYGWDFGDSCSGTGVSPIHTYANAGNYSVVLTVTDNSGLTGSTTGTVIVSSGNPVSSFTASPSEGLAPLNVSFDATTSWAVVGSIVSYRWAYGDGVSGSGITSSHTYTAVGDYTATLTVTDSRGLIGTATRAITVLPELSAVSLSGNPAPPVGVGSPVTLTATPVGGYQVLYRFLGNDGSGWQVLRDFDGASSYTWTPGSTGNYQFQVYAKSAQSADPYEAASQVLNYEVVAIPSSGLRMWLRADAGVSQSDGMVSSWSDQSGQANNLSQSNLVYQPSIVENAVNGLPIVRFSGNNCSLQTTATVLSGSTPFTAFAVFRINSLPGTNYQYIWWNGTDSTTAGYGQYISSAGKLRTSWGGSTSQITLASPPTTGIWYRTCARYTPGAQEAWLNGASLTGNTPSSSNLAAGFAVGNCAASEAYQGFFGDVAEIMIYNRKLSDTEMQAVDTYLVSRWWPIPPVQKDRISDMKALVDGRAVSITSAKVATVASGTFTDGSCYVEEPDRSSGIKVMGATLALWENVTLTGTLSTGANGERVLNVTSVDSRASGTETVALGMVNKSISTPGLLVRVWGKVIDKTASYLTLDDGSGAAAKLRIDGLIAVISALPSVGDYVSATGIAGYMSAGATEVRVRSGSDIRIY